MGKLTDVLRVWRIAKKVSALLIQTSFTQGKAVISEGKVLRIRVFYSYAAPETKWTVFTELRQSFVTQLTKLQGGEDCVNSGRTVWEGVRATWLWRNNSEFAWGLNTTVSWLDGFGRSKYLLHDWTMSNYEWQSGSPSWHRDASGADSRPCLCNENECCTELQRLFDKCECLLLLESHHICWH